MKAYIKFGVLVMAIFALCVGFSSCSDDDDDDYGTVKEFTEWVIDGKTYKNEYVTWLNPTLSFYQISNLITSTHKMTGRLFIPEFERDFKEYQQPDIYGVTSVYRMDDYFEF